MLLALLPPKGRQNARLALRKSLRTRRYAYIASSHWHFAIRLCISLAASILVTHSQAETLVDIYELALENDAQLKSQIAQYNADLELEKLALAPLLPQARAGYSFTDSKNDLPDPTVLVENPTPGASLFEQVDVTTITNTETDGYDVKLSQTLFDPSAWFGWKAGKPPDSGSKSLCSTARPNRQGGAGLLWCIGAQDNLRASQAQERAFERQLEQTRQWFEVGLIAITDVYEARLRAIWRK